MSAQSDADVAALAFALGSNTQRADLVAPPFTLLRGWALALGLSLALNAVAIAGAAGTVAASRMPVPATLFPLHVPGNMTLSTSAEVSHYSAVWCTGTALI